MNEKTINNYIQDPFYQKHSIYVLSFIYKNN